MAHNGRCPVFNPYRYIDGENTQHDPEIGSSETKAGSGPVKFAIDKHDNNKGQFIKRTDFVIFEKILTFEVSEYTAAKQTKINPSEARRDYFCMLLNSV
ncbi:MULTISPECIES: hypothetical protein [unclassified Paenibacillus]|uniref:hypothetical protein n=1 Tax=unclassified Paenibacillus TaxID=185978 RepID=UPI0030FAA80F